MGGILSAFVSLVLGLTVGLSHPVATPADSNSVQEQVSAHKGEVKDAKSEIVEQAKALKNTVGQALDQLSLTANATSNVATNTTDNTTVNTTDNTTSNVTSNTTTNTTVDEDEGEENEQERVDAINLKSGKVMPVALPKVAVEHSEALDFSSNTTLGSSQVHGNGKVSVED